MKWTSDAEEMIQKVPFFVRKRVRKRVEKDASDLGKRMVSVEDVKRTKASYLSNMASEIKGYQISTCFGATDCPNRISDSQKLVSGLETLLKKEDLLTFLKTHVTGSLKFHHEFRIAVADCPNACSQPQIMDIGIIAAVAPEIDDRLCNQCGDCTDICPDQALNTPVSDYPRIDAAACMLCGKCIQACPMSALKAHRSGYTILLGGKLGRHPQLAQPLPGIYTIEDVMTIVQACISFYKQHSRAGKRFAEILTQQDFERFAAAYSQKREKA